MITLNTSMCGATANFPEAVMATLGGQLVVFDYTPDQAGGSGPGAYCEGYLPRDPQVAGMYEIFGYMPDDWYFYDGDSFEWWNDCTLINGVDGAAGFTFHGIAFQPESMPVVRTGSGCRPSVRQLQQALSAATMLAPDPDRSRTTTAVRLTVDKPIHRSIVAARFASRQPALTGFGNPTLDSLQSNLVCVWKLEEGAGTRIDVISGEDLSAHNSPASAVGKDGQACAFVNASSHGLYRDQTLLGPLGAHETDTEIAFSTWLYANTVGYRSIAGFIDEMGGMGPWSLSLGYQNRIYLNVNTYNWNDSAYAQTGSISAGQWYSIVFTFSSTGHLRLYVNGALAATGDTYGGTGGLAEPYSPFTLGCGQVYDYEHDTTGFGNSWDGLIDETCVWNVVPDDPDAFAGALWNSGRGAFYLIDNKRRTISGIVSSARQRMDFRHRARFQAAAVVVLAATNARFDAVARIFRACPVVRTSVRALNGNRSADMFDFIFGIDPTRAAVAVRPAARQLPGTVFGNPVLDAIGEHLVACWKLEEHTGERIDAISSEHLTPHNAPTAAPGRDGQANRFSNAQANGLFREMEDLGPLGSHGPDVELSVSTWLYADSLGYRSVAGFIDEMGYMGPWSMTVGYQNRLYVNIATPDWDNAYVQSGSLATGQWYHVFFTYDASGNVRLYLNGVLAATGSTYSGNGGLAQPYSPFTLGCGHAYDYEHDTYGYGNSWDGLIDETCVWNAVPENPDVFAAALWNAGQGTFLHIDPRQRAIIAARGDLRADTRVAAGARMTADQELARSATPARALATRYTTETNTAAWADARAQHRLLRVVRADAEYIVALTRVQSAARAGVRRDMDAVNCARTVLGLDARSTTTTAGAAFLKALVERLHADHGVRLGAGTKATFTASGDLFDIRAVNRVTTGEHPGARKLLVWTIPHLTSARDTTGSRTPILYLARARQNALHRVRLTLRAPQTAAVQSRHDAFVQAGWRLVARNALTGEELDLGFVPAGNDTADGTLVDVALPDGDWQIEPRPAEWFWTDCRGRAASSVSIRDGRILHAGLPAILNLRGEILNQRRVVRWEIAAELLPQAFQFGIWTGATSPVDTTGQPLATVPFSAGRGSYLHAFTQSEPLHLAVAAFDAEGMGPEVEILLDWAAAPPASPVNQLAR